MKNSNLLKVILSRCAPRWQSLAFGAPAFAQRTAVAGHGGGGGGGGSHGGGRWRFSWRRWRAGVARVSGAAVALPGVRAERLRARFHGRALARNRGYGARPERHERRQVCGSSAIRARASARRQGRSGSSMAARNSETLEATGNRGTGNAAAGNRGAAPSSYIRSGDSGSSRAGGARSGRRLETAVGGTAGVGHAFKRA